MVKVEELKEKKESAEIKKENLEASKNPLVKSFNHICDHVKSCKCVAKVATAAAFVEGAILTSTEDYLVAAKEGMTVLETLGGKVGIGFICASALVAGIAYGKAVVNEVRADKKAEEIELIDKRIAKQDQIIEKYDSQILYSDGGQTAIRNVAEQTGIPVEKFEQAGTLRTDDPVDAQVLHDDPVAAPTAKDEMMEMFSKFRSIKHDIAPTVEHDNAPGEVPEE